MKKNILILLAAVALLGTSCEKFLSVNEENPNSASKVSAKLVLPACLNRISTTMNNPRRFDFVYLWHGLWSISAGYSQPQNLVQYKLLNSNYQGVFNELYVAGENLDLIEKGATDAKDCNYLAIAKIMKAYMFQVLVDCYGDVPYTDAFKAPANLKPKYDKQQTIYEDLVVQLDAAIALIQNAPANATTIDEASDIIFGGDMNLWAKFANTIKLRILVHQADMTGRTSYINEKVATTSAVGYLGVGEGALVDPGYVTSAGKMNVFYETFYNAAGTSQSDGITYYMAGKDAIDFLKSVNDPRLAKLYQSYSTTSSVYEGNYFGELPADLTAANLTSKLGYDAAGDPGTMIGTPDKPEPLLTDFESLFIQAEAAQRGIISGDAKALYEAAVTRSFLFMGLSSGLANNYVNQSYALTSWDVSTNKIQLIVTQKWIALDGVSPAEIWTDYRRTGYPVGLHFSVDPAKENPTPPVRLLYPQNEVDVNNDNVVAVGPIDAFTSKIFWQNR